VTGRGVADRVTFGRGSQGIHGFRNGDAVRGLDEVVLELPSLPFFTVMIT
jgi:hypothetical protein